MVPAATAPVSANLELTSAIWEEFVDCADNDIFRSRE
ncbi:hypothetical protein [Micromonospora qiuiae]